MKLLGLSALISLALCLGTAILTSVLLPTSPGYYLIMQAHVVGSWALLLLGIPALMLHLKETLSPRKAVLALLAVALPLALLSTLPYAIPDETGTTDYLLKTWDDLHRAVEAEGAAGAARTAGEVLDRGLPGPAAALALAAGAFFLSLLAMAPRIFSWPSVRWSGLALVLLVLWALSTGAAQSWVPRLNLFQEIAVHTTVGSLALLVALHHLLSSSRWTQGKSPLRAWAQSLVGVALLAGLLGFGLLRKNDRSDDGLDLPPGMLQAQTAANHDERAASLANDDWVHLPPTALKDNHTCGSVGCHPTIAAEWAGSPHRWSANNAFYRKAVGVILDEGNLDGALFCANCHDPERALSGTLARDYANGVPEEGSPGVSCVVCHSVTAYLETPDGGKRGNGLFEVATSRPNHPRAGEGLKRAVRLDLRRHLSEFAIDGVVQDRGLCETCHRVELGPDLGSVHLHVEQDQATASRDPKAYVPQCNDCHLPWRRREGGGSPRFQNYTHAMAGINADLIHYATRPDPVEAKFIETHAKRAQALAALTPWIPLEDPEWPLEPPGPWHEYEIVEERPKRALELELQAGPGAPGTIEVEARTTNMRIGHDFPSGPMDLQEVWLELLLRDQTGRILVHRGSLGPEGQVEDPAARLGARVVDRQGEPLEKHQLFQMASAQDKEVLGAGFPVAQPRAHRWTLPVIPEAQWPLELRARWLFRRANPRFTAWALGDDKAPLPTWELANATATLQPEALSPKP